MCGMKSPPASHIITCLTHNGALIKFLEVLFTTSGKNVKEVSSSQSAVCYLVGNWAVWFILVASQDLMKWGGSQETVVIWTTHQPSADLSAHSPNFGAVVEMWLAYPAHACSQCHWAWQWFFHSWDPCQALCHQELDKGSEAPAAGSIQVTARRGSREARDKGREQVRTPSLAL